MQTKLSKLKAAAQQGDWQGALRIAARFPQLGTHQAAIKRGHEAFENGRFYEQIGQEPKALVAAGIAALQQRYNLDGQGNEKMKTYSKRANAARAAKAAGLNPDSLEFYADASGNWAWKEPAAEADDEVPAFLKKGSVMAKVEAVAQVQAETPVPEKAKRQPTARYADMFEAASRGELPNAPDLTAPTHKAFAKRGAAIIAMAEAGDLDGLRADTMEPKSSTRAMICRYRDAAIFALIARTRSAA